MKLQLAAVAAFTALATLPANALTTWQGDVFLKTATGPCEAQGITADTFYRGIYRPANIDDNGTSMELAFIGTRGAFHFEKTGAFANGSWTSAAISARAHLFSYTATVTAAKSAPASPTMTTQAITLSGKIANYFGAAGCTVTFIGTFGLRPE